MKIAKLIAEEAMTDLRKREAKFKLGDQWYYRGNVSPTWLYCASRADGSMCGISEKVPKAEWQRLEDIAELIAERVAEERKRCVIACRDVKPMMYGSNSRIKDAWDDAVDACISEIEKEST